MDKGQELDFGLTGYGRGLADGRVAGVGGALLAIDTSVDPSTGSRLILLIFGKFHFLGWEGAGDDPYGNTRLGITATGAVDIGILWGPIAGYYAKRVHDVDLVLIPLKSEPGVKFDYEIAMGVRYGEREWKDTVEKLITDNRPAITQILREYNVSQMPVVKAEPPVMAAEGVGSVVERDLLDALFAEDGQSVGEGGVALLPAHGDQRGLQRIGVAGRERGQARARIEAAGVEEIRAHAPRLQRELAEADRPDLEEAPDQRLVRDVHAPRPCGQALSAVVRMRSNFSIGRS